MKRTIIPALAAVLLLTLTGCAGGAEDAADERTAPALTPSATTAAPSAAPTATAAPITEEPVSPDPSIAPSQADNEIEFIAYTAPFLADQGYNLTDEQVLGAGLYACELIAQGGNPEVITVVEGSPEYVSEQVAANAVSMLCPID